MKISLDFDGTTWQHQDFFRNFMCAMQASGHQVGMLTGHDQYMKNDDINLMLKRGFPKPDFYLARTDKSLPTAEFKVQMIKEHNIDYHFDDLDFSNPHTIEILGGHPRLMRCWHDGPKGSHMKRPNG